MKFLIVTNRRIRDGQATDESLFGESVNARGASELRLAWAERVGDCWVLALIEEPNRLSTDNLPSQDAFKAYMEMLCSQDKDCVFYVHGFNQSFKDSLEQSYALQQRYGVGVVTFSWPAKPGGFITDEYREARAIASNSIVALDRTFEKLAENMRAQPDEYCNISLNLLVHSLGNLIFQRFVEAPIFTGETRIFDNIVLNAADVDVFGHEHWTNALKYARNVYATINERDSILALSDVINPDRLGNTAKHLRSNAVGYLDLSDGDGVKKKHQHFESTAEHNTVVNRFFEMVLSGQPGLPLEGTRMRREPNVFELLRDG